MRAKTLEVMFSWPLFFELIQSPRTCSPKHHLAARRLLFCPEARVAPTDKHRPLLGRAGIKGEAGKSTDHMGPWAR